MITLKELIKVRKNKFVSKCQATCCDFWQGYQCGWEWAYRDLEEILEQNKFDTTAMVVKGDIE